LWNAAIRPSVPETNIVMLDLERDGDVADVERAAGIIRETLR